MDAAHFHPVNNEPSLIVDDIFLTPKLHPILTILVLIAPDISNAHENVRARPQIYNHCKIDN